MSVGDVGLVVTSLRVLRSRHRCTATSCILHYESSAVATYRAGLPTSKMLPGIVDRFARAYVRGFAAVLKLSSFALQFRQVADAHYQLGSQVFGVFPLDA